MSEKLNNNNNQENVDIWIRKTLSVISDKSRELISMIEILSEEEERLEGVIKKNMIEGDVNQMVTYQIELDDIRKRKKDALRKFID